MSSKGFVVLRGIKEGNRFFSTHTEGNDPTKLANGETAYTVLGYYDSVEECQVFLYGCSYPNPNVKDR